MFGGCFITLATVLLINQHVHCDKDKTRISNIVLEKINFTKQELQTQISNSDILKLINIVKNKNTSLPMLNYILESVENLSHKNNIPDSVLLEKYFFNKLNTVGNLSKKVFSRYISQTKNMKNPRMIMNFMKAKREDDPDDLIGLFMDWALKIQNRITFENMFNHLELLDRTFKLAVFRMQIRKRLDNNPLYNDKFINDDNYNFLSRDQLKRHVETLLGVIGEELESVDNTSCYLNSIDRMKWTITQAKTTKPMIYLIAEIASNMLYTEDSEVFKEYLTSYIEHKIETLGEQGNEISSNLSTKSPEDLIMHLTTEEMGILIMRWQTLVTQQISNTNSTQQNIWTLLEDNFKEVTSSIFACYTPDLNATRAKLQTHIQQIAPIVALAMNIGNVHPDDLKVVYYANLITQRSNVTVDILIFIDDYLNALLNGSVDHAAEFERILNSYQLKKLNRIASITAKQFHRILNLSDREKELKFEEFMTRNPNDIETFVILWKEINDEMMKMMDNYFETLENSFQSTLKMILKYSNKFIIERMVCQFS